MCNYQLSLLQITITNTHMDTTFPYSQLIMPIRQKMLQFLKNGNVDHKFIDHIHMSCILIEFR